MMDVQDLVTLANGGATLLLVAAVVALWRRLNVVTDRMTTYLEERADQGDIAAQRAKDHGR